MQILKDELALLCFINSIFQVSILYLAIHLENFLSNKVIPNKGQLILQLDIITIYKTIFLPVFTSVHANIIYKKTRE